MSRVITSPVKKFPGTVTLADPLNFLQAAAFEKSLADMRELGENATQTEADAAMIPGITACIEAWELAGVNGFIPATPRRASMQLIAWLVGEIAKLYQDADAVPLA